MIEKLDGMTKDLVEENITKIKELFPSVVKENKIDFELLQTILGADICNDKEQYSFVWNGKTEATKLAQKRSTGTLRPCIEESKNWDTTENLYIEGDNLEVLRLLQNSYSGSIKMIYIDPPYNTGHDFVYRDKFEDNIANYKEITKQAQKSNANTDGRYHTNWLNMMYPRLKLARTLLKKDGVIFISIDDNEQANLKKLCDDVFGEDNFVNLIVWHSNPGGGKGDGIETTKQYIFVYARNKTLLGNLGLVKQQKISDYPLKDAKSNYRRGGQLEKWGNADTIYTHPNLGYSIYFNPIENKVEIKYDYNKDKLLKNRKLKLKYEKEDENLLKKGYFCIRPRITNAGQPGRWRVEEQTFLERFNNDDFIFEKQEDNYKIYEKDRFEQYKFTKMKDMITDIKQTNDTIELFDGKKVFSYPKPTKFMEYLIKNIEDKDFTVMDFFSGSGTTANAVFKVNFEDGGKRKFICVQLPENLDENFKNTSEKDIVKNAINLCNQIHTPHYLTEIAKERIRRAGLKIEKETKSENIDTGFKVFKLDSSNIKKWNNSPTTDIDEISKRIQLSIDYLEDDRSELDLVYEIMLKFGVDLTSKLGKTKNGKAFIVNANDENILICSQQNITFEDIEQFSNENADIFLFADRCFENDNVLINAQEILKSKEKEIKLF